MITIKHGDTHDIVEKVNMDLTGCTVRWVVRLEGSPTAGVLPASIATPATDGRVRHRLDGTLPEGEHQYEIQVTRDGQTWTAPTNGFGRLRVNADLE